MNQILIRPFSALFPIACLIAALNGQGEPVLFLLLFYFTLELVTLCSSETFRNAAACEPGVKRVDKRFGGALVQTLIGILLLLAAVCFLPQPADGVLRLKPALFLIGTSSCIIIEHLFEERMYALGRKVDGALMSLITNLLLSIGLFFPGRDYLFLFIMNCGSMLLSALISMLLVPSRAFALLPINYPFAPRAVLQTLLYPVAIAALMYFGKAEIAPATVGWILWRISRTVYRRTEDESRPLNLALIAVCSVIIAASAVFPFLQTTSFACLTAFICACVVFLRPSARLYAAAALMLAGCTAANCTLLSIPIQIAAACLLCACAVILNLKNAARRRARA